MNLPILQGMTAIGLVIAAGCGVLLYRQLRAWGPVGRIAGTFLPLFALLALFTLTVELMDAAHYHWNPPRLAPAFALWQGYPMYYGPDNGPVLGNIYGPGLAVAYLPTVLFPLPSQALQAGVLLTALYFFLPLIGVHWKGVVMDPRRSVLAGLTMIGFSSILMNSPPLGRLAFSIHADAPAMSLCGLACVFLHGEQDRTSRRVWLPAALCSVLAVWTKQTAAPILLALPLYLWYVERPQVGLRYVLWLTIVLIIVSGMFLICFGVRPLLFNMFVVPSHHPWFTGIDGFKIRWLRNLVPPGNVRALLEAGGQLLKFSVGPLIILMGYVGWQRLFSPAKTIPFRAWLRTQPWLLPAWLGVCLIPTSLLGRVKVGGDLNSLSFSCYFFFLAASLVLVNLASCLSEHRFHRFEKWILLSAFCGFGLLSLPLWDQADSAWRRLAKRPPALSDQAFHFIRQHPGESYFPWDPLAHLLAEQKLYHFSYGVFDRALAGFPLTVEHVHSGLPPYLKFVVQASDSQPLEYLPEFNQPDAGYIKEMPGWIFLSRKP